MDTIQSSKTKVELIQYCKDNKIKGYSGKNKDDIIKLIKSLTKKQEEKQEEKQEPNTVMKPFIKWVGGKTQIIDTVLTLFPSHIQNYHEPFLGGGSVLLGLLSYIQMGKIKVSGKIYASDFNKALIYCYINIQHNINELLQELTILSNEFYEIKDSIINRQPKDKIEACSSYESYYYWIRSQYNQSDKITNKSSAMFIFLNKTCFRGLYREGPNGFNVPYGNYKHPGIYDETHLRLISKLIQPVIFTQATFQTSFKNIISGDFVYLDPPYVPEQKTSFVSYNANGFTLETHTELFKKIKQFHQFLMSNSHVQLVTDEFPLPYITHIISCRRAINSKSPDSKTNEVLIKNYE